MTVVLRDLAAAQGLQQAASAVYLAWLAALLQY